MKANEPSTEELTDRTDRRNHLGIDSGGRDHHLSMQLGPVSYGVVWVVDGDTIVHTQIVDGASQWVEHVANQCGWETCTYTDEPLDEWLAATVAEAM